MEKLFENKTTYTQDIYLEFLKFHSKTYNFSYMLYTIFWILLFLLCIYLSFTSNLREQGILLTFVLVCFVLYRFYHPKMILDNELKSDKFSDNNTNTFSFFDKNFVVENHNGSFSYRYMMLHKVFETNNYFYLYITKENAFLISKDSFSLGSAQAFSTFIKKKCNFKYKKIV